jgi:dual specificity protein kinase YAK1
MRTHDICAVKVVKNKPAYLNQSKMEVAILDLVSGRLRIWVISADASFS